MRRLLSLILILLLAFGLSACADPAPEQPITPDAPNTPDTPNTPDAPADPAPEQPNTPDAPADTPLHYDTDGDGSCDHCNTPMCLLSDPIEHIDANFDCACDLCGRVEHIHGTGMYCGICENCRVALDIVDTNSDGLCDLNSCGQPHGGENHPHIEQSGDALCDICSADLTPKAPVLSVTVTAETATLTVEPQQGVQRYDVTVNGVLRSSFSGTTYTVQDNLIAVGVNEICVRAVTDVGESPDSNAVTVGRLADPQYHATGTGVEFLWGDVPNAQGYIIYGDDGAYLATIGLGETYDFAYLYTADGFYFPYIQAYAEGFISSQKCGIPVMIGSNGGPIGG
jgi:hypothetical protein